MPRVFKDYYQILGVSPQADLKTIRTAYRKLARQHHPDLNPSVLAAMRQCRYEPALNNGKPVAVFLTVTILLHPAP